MKDTWGEKKECTLYTCKVEKRKGIDICNFKSCDLVWLMTDDCWRWKEFHCTCTGMCIFGKKEFYASHITHHTASATVTSNNEENYEEWSIWQMWKLSIQTKARTRMSQYETNLKRLSCGISISPYIVILWKVAQPN